MTLGDFRKKTEKFEEETEIILESNQKPITAVHYNEYLYSLSPIPEKRLLICGN
jgi:hypothetical protein